MNDYIKGLITGFILAILGGALVIELVQEPIMTTEACDEQQQLLIERISELYDENTLLTKKLTKYEADEAYIKSLPGASEDTAQKIIKASGALNVDPK